MNEDKVFCTYCGKEAEWVENKEIYGRNYGKSYMCWLCRPCEAFVGCHNNTKRPLGTFANRELRGLRKQVHLYIDQFWKSGQLKRAWVYSRISKELGFQYHTGESTPEICKKILALPYKFFDPKPERVEAI